MTESQIAIMREKARNKRYKKPANRDLNLGNIESTLAEIYWECNDVEYYFEADDDELLTELLGGEDQFHEFKVMFSCLAADCDHMLDDMKWGWIPNFFDVFFAAMSDSKQDLIGWDSYESDYFGLSDTYENELAIREAQKKLSNHTKSDIINGAGQCFRLAVNFLSIRSRYEDLKASMDIIRETNKAELDVLRHINELYDKTSEDSMGFRYHHGKAVNELDRLLNAIDPYSRIWLQ